MNQINFTPLPKVIYAGTKPTAVQEKAVDQAGAKAVSDYKHAIANSMKRTQLAEALTGKKAKDISKDQKTKIDNYLKEVAEKDAAPNFDAAATGSAKDVAKGNRKLGGEILKQGVDGAYVAEKKTALISNDLVGKGGKETAQLKAAVREEAGEWLAAGAAKAGVKVGVGDAGNRLALALDGKMNEVQDRSLNTNSKADKTTVRIGQETYQAEAKQTANFAPPKTPQKGIWFTGVAKGWRLTIPIAKNNKVIVNDGAADWHKSADYIGTSIPVGYNGIVTLSEKTTTVRVKIENYGQSNERVVSMSPRWKVLSVRNGDTFKIVSSVEMNPPRRDPPYNGSGDR